MFKENLRSMMKFIASKEFVALVIFLVLLWALYSYSTNKVNVFDGMNTGMDSSANTATATSASHEVYASNSTDVTGGYEHRSVTNPTDLLPQDHNSEWAQLNPVNQGNAAMPDLLHAGANLGITVSQVMRNSSLDVRSDPIIPKRDIGPWNQSTIEPDLGRVPFEVGCGSR